MSAVEICARAAWAPWALRRGGGCWVSSEVTCCCGLDGCGCETRARCGFVRYASSSSGGCEGGLIRGRRYMCGLRGNCCC